MVGLCFGPCRAWLGSQLLASGRPALVAGAAGGTSSGKPPGGPFSASSRGTTGRTPRPPSTPARSGFIGRAPAVVGYESPRLPCGRPSIRLRTENLAGRRVENTFEVEIGRLRLRQAEGVPRERCRLRVGGLDHRGGG